MKITFHVPASRQDQDQLQATIKRLFPAAIPEVTQRATGTSNIDWQDLGSLSDLLGAQIVYSTFVTFTIEAPESYNEEQQQFLARSGIEHHREIDPEELRRELERDDRP